MQRTFSIITVCKSRLDHLKQSLPCMLAQGAKEVIVVDYSCPEGSADYVEANLPGAQVVRAEKEEGFSNWRGRNLGAAAATGDVLVFCDADTIMADGAIEWIAQNLPQRAFGFFKAIDTAHLSRKDLRLSQNQLRGFLVVPSAAFRQLGGYDEVLRGYAAGGDTDLVDRMALLRLSAFPMDAKIISSVIGHDNDDRLKHHSDPITLSYGAGLLYRSAKLALLRLRGRVNLPLATRETIYDAAKNAASQIGEQKNVGMTVKVAVDPIRMPRQLGFEKGSQTLSLKIDIAMDEKLPEIPG